jgi:hypothetical protein
MVAKDDQSDAAMRSRGFDIRGVGGDPTLAFRKFDVRHTCNLPHNP